jgi:hypothetical protein
MKEYDISEIGKKTVYTDFFHVLGWLGKMKVEGPSKERKID